MLVNAPVTDRYSWIQTRDGSPTLWDNELAEPFRSVKGAYSESWEAFVEPALKRALLAPQQLIQLGEFGLGPGTNWLLWSLSAKLHQLSFHYFVIERHSQIFFDAQKKWASESNNLFSFLKAKFSFSINDGQFQDLVLETLSESPKIFSSIEQATTELKQTCHYWFHDPFGYEINPEGYSSETIHKLKPLWSKNIFGCSYACNKHFQNVLEGAGLNVQTQAFQNKSLKRERLEFQSSI